MFRLAGLGRQASRSQIAISSSCTTLQTLGVSEFHPSNAVDTLAVSTTSDMPASSLEGIRPGAVSEVDLKLNLSLKTPIVSARASAHASDSDWNTLTAAAHPQAPHPSSGRPPSTVPLAGASQEDTGMPDYDVHSELEHEGKSFYSVAASLVP
jgi:hypothetical protein